MHAYLAHIGMNLRLTFRDRTVVFFNYLFPLIFFFLFGQMLHAEQGGGAQLVNMVLTIGVLGTGLFGAGMRAVMDREQNILRRFKVAPISAAPILVSSLVTGLAHYMPLVILILALTHWIYGMPVPDRLFSLLLFVSLGVVAFRAVGMIIASVANSMQESQILIQILYLPMLFLSGATIPIAIMPNWVQIIAQFLPATHLSTGLSAILLGRESILDNGTAVLALSVTAVVGTFLGVKLFRWEKEEKMRASAKLWLLAVLAPFLLLGGWQAYSRDSVGKARILARQLRRSHTVLIRDARIFVGDGEVIESGAVLVKNGKIAEIYRGQAPEPKALSADLVEASGKTLLPGLVDVHVHLTAPGGFYESPQDYQREQAPDRIARSLAAYLYSGVTAVKSAGDAIETVLDLRRHIDAGRWLGAELFLSGPMFTLEGGHGTEYFRFMPDGVRRVMEQQMVRLPKSPQEARRQVSELKKQGVDAIKAILDAGQPGLLFNRMDLAILRAISEQAVAEHLPIACHTGNARDVADALVAGVNGIEHGSMRDDIPAELWARMRQQSVTYDPTLAAAEGIAAAGAGKADLLERSLVQQVAVPALIAGTKKMLVSETFAGMRTGLQRFAEANARGPQNLMAAWRAGVTLVTGTDSGNALLIHGPALHRELQLWVQAGIPPAVALQAATGNAARLLGAANRFGMIRKGYEASLLLVDGNPLQDIAVTERISMVMLKGERINRPALFDQD